MKKIKIIASLFILNSNVLIAQTYVSPKQRTTTSGFADKFETELVKKVVIDKNSFRAELPDGAILSGSIELFRTIERNNEKRTVYKIVSGGILSINDDLEDDNWDSIVLNLLATSKKKVYTFWLTKGNKGDD